VSTEPFLRQKERIVLSLHVAMQISPATRPKRCIGAIIVSESDVKVTLVKTQDYLAILSK